VILAEHIQVSPFLLCVCFVDCVTFFFYVIYYVIETLQGDAIEFILCFIEFLVNLDQITIVKVVKP